MALQELVRCPSKLSQHLLLLVYNACPAHAGCLQSHIAPERKHYKASHAPSTATKGASDALDVINAHPTLCGSAGQAHALGNTKESNTTLSWHAFVQVQLHPTVTPCQMAGNTPSITGCSAGGTRRPLQQNH